MPTRVGSGHTLVPTILLILLVGYSFALSSSGPNNNSMASSRHVFLKQLTALTLSSLALSVNPGMAFSMSSSGNDPIPRVKSSSSTSNGINGSFSSTQQKVAYRPLSVNMQEFGINVPVAMWYPAPDREQAQESFGGRQRTPPIMDFPNVKDSASSPAKKGSAVKYYNHHISVKRIGQLLAGWNFVPEFVSQDFRLEPTLRANAVLDGQGMPLPKTGPVVLLAHGYLGSRFDLSHIAEELAQQGFICLSPEYPESLAASYPRMEGLDRASINSQMLTSLKSDWGIDGTSFGIVGHSLGCGTAMSTGDDDWTRVLIAGFPRESCRGRVLWLSSTNDGTASLSRMGTAIPSDYVQLQESSVLQQRNKLPPRAALVFDRPDAPNHISFLADGVNNAMINLLSPLLPVAQALEIPVLDFDKYQKSRDSRQTAEVVVPLIASYLKQYML